MAFEGDGDPGKAQRFRAAALPYLDDVYTVARYLLSNPADAEDAVQECYLRAFRHFETFRGGPIKPWLLAILRNVCRVEYARRGAQAAVQADGADDADAGAENLWGGAEPTPEAQTLRRLPQHLQGAEARLACQLLVTAPMTVRRGGIEPPAGGSAG